MLVSVHTAEREMKTKKPKALANFRFFLASCEAKYGGSCRIRTYDQLVKSQLLYQLS